jgi:predicted AAA+ superfamily ATPase
MWVPRSLEKDIVETVSTRPAILLTGVRQSGKSALLKKLFPKAVYVTLDKILIAESAEENPSAFLHQFDNVSSVILDEIQYAPSLFRELKIIIDENRDQFGKWILTGSQKFTLMKNGSESLAGRLSILNLETLSAEELRNSHYFKDVDDILWKGGYPEVWVYPKINPAQFYESYIQTYLEKDLRQIIQVSNLRDFQRFVRACAVRVGNLINYAELAKDIGISSNTTKSWINTLEASGLIVLLSPYAANIGKRLIKAPKIYFSDQGLLCNLLNIYHKENLKGHIYEGALWENFVFTELIKTGALRPSRNIFFYRDQNNVEVDFLVESDNQLTLIEAKSAEIVPPQKLNFHKVTNLFKGRELKSVLACKIKESSPLLKKEYSIINPLRTAFSEIPLYQK